MGTTLSFRKEFDENNQKAFGNGKKTGLLCTVAPDGYPHISLISSISVKNKKTLMWGQFSQGLSKEYIKDNAKTGFLVVSPDRFWWTGKALYTGSTVKGEDFNSFIESPLFCSNSSDGFGTVHYEDLFDVSAGEKLPSFKISFGFFLSGRIKNSVQKNVAFLKPAHEQGDSKIEKMPPYGIKLACTPKSLKFAAYIDTNGYPRIYPCMQGLAADANRMVFSSVPYGDLLKQIPQGAKTAVFLANQEQENLLLQGRWFNTVKGDRLKNSLLEIDKVYNSMLPASGYI